MSNEQPSVADALAAEHARQAREGGAAFPVLQSDTLYPLDSGMSLRDYFAGQALAGLLVNTFVDVRVASEAYKIADAMIAERNKR